MTETFLNKFYKNKKSTFLFNLVISFGLGIIFSPITNGIFFLIALSLISEILCYIFTKGDENYWNPIHKPFILFSYILGWYIGKFLTTPKDTIIVDGIPSIEDYDYFN